MALDVYDPNNPYNDQLMAQLYPVPQTPVVNPVQAQAAGMADQVMAGEQPVINPVPASTPLVKEGSSVAVSERGYSQEKDAQLTASQAGMEQKNQKSANKHYAQANQFATAYGDVAERQRQSLAAQTDIEVQKQDLESQYNADMAKMNSDYMAKEQEYMARAQAESQKYMADYGSMLQEIRATNINPGKLFADMTGGEQSGMLVTAFVNDFLGTKGIKTSAMDTYNKAVERSIDAQIANLNNKKVVADGFRQMWDMQRAMSKTDEEARARIHGIALQSLKDTVASKLASYDSELARARLPAAVAAIDKALIDTTVTLDETARKRTFEDAKFEFDKWATKAGLAMQSRSLKLQEDRAAMEKAAMGGIDPKVAEVVVRGDGGQVLGRAGDKDRAKDLQARVDGAAKMTRNFERMRELQRKLKSTYKGFGASYITSNDKAELESLINETKADYLRAVSGLTVNESEAKRLDQVFNTDSMMREFFSGEDIGLVVNAKFNQRLIENTQEQIKNGLMPMSPDDARKYGGGTNYDYLESQKVAAQEAGINAKPTTTEVQQAKSVLGEGTEPSNKFQTATKFGENTANDAAAYAQDAFSHGRSLGKEWQGGGKATGWFDAMSDLKEMAIDLSLDDQTRQDAIAALVEATNKGVAGGEESVYAARWMLSEIAKVEESRRQPVSSPAQVIDYEDVVNTNLDKFTQPVPSIRK